MTDHHDEPDGDARLRLVRRALARIGITPADDDLSDGEDQLAGFLTDFRAAPSELREFLDDVPDADDVYARYARLVAAVGDGAHPERRDVFDAYFVVRKPAPVARDRAEALIRQHYAAMRALVDEAGDADDLVAQLGAATAIAWRPSPPSRDHDSLDADVHDVVFDYLRETAGAHPILGLHEAAYTLAASYSIAAYMLWPAYRTDVRAEDPFRPFVELWSHGVQWQHAGNVIEAWKPET